MLNKLRERTQDEKGFTLIELLVVILIIGILAAIALPAFLGQRVKGQDSSAKSNVRNLVSHMESCFTDNETYAGCQTKLTAGNTGLDIGTGSGQVAVVGTPTTTAYVITGLSKSGNSFTYTHNSAVTPVNSRTCVVAANQDSGGCANVSGTAGTW